jgi:hypothetical protein
MPRGTLLVPGIASNLPQSLKESRRWIMLVIPRDSHAVHDSPLGAVFDGATGFAAVEDPIEPGRRSYRNRRI